MIITNFYGKYSFLSNFAFSLIKLDCGTVLRSVEGAYQAYKTQNLMWRKSIQDAPSPSKANQLGNNAPLRPDWEEIKEGIMLNLLRMKFEQNPEMGQLLLDTDDALLIEGNNWHDNIWGTCECLKCKDVQGQNLLGQLLMDVRKELRELNE